MGQITKPPTNQELAVELFVRFRSYNPHVNRSKAVQREKELYAEGMKLMRDKMIQRDAAVVERLREIRESLALNDWDRIHGDELDKLDALIIDLEP